MHPLFRPFIHGPLDTHPFLLRSLKFLFGCLFLVPLRFSLGSIMILFYWLFCRVIFLGVEHRNLSNYMTRLKILKRFTHYYVRFGLGVLGFYKIRISGEPDPTIKTLISNHVSYLDMLYFMYAQCPSFVAKESIKTVPLFGYIAKLCRCIFVSHVREKNLSPKTSSTGTLISFQTSLDPSSSPIVVFPEGTTTNGNFLISFRTGAFVAGIPVQPVILKYPHARFNLSWETIPVLYHVFFMLVQIYNNLSVIYLPVYVPDESEKQDPRLYANNVRNLMARVGELELSDATVGDKMKYHELILEGRLSWKDVGLNVEGASATNYRTF